MKIVSSAFLITTIFAFLIKRYGEWMTISFDPRNNDLSERLSVHVEVDDWIAATLTGIQLDRLRLVMKDVLFKLAV